MGLYSITGTVSAIGQSSFDNELHLYAYVVVTDQTGRRHMIDKVAVGNDVGSYLTIGLYGEFFFDSFFGNRSKLRCQLWGVKADAGSVIDRTNLRTMVTASNLIQGIFLLPFFGIGLFSLLRGLFQLFDAVTGRVDRQRFFNDPNDQTAPQALPGVSKFSMSLAPHIRASSQQ
jgi:hypothetical protein